MMVVAVVVHDFCVKKLMIAHENLQFPFLLR